MKAEREARDEASKIFKTISPEAGNKEISRRDSSIFSDPSWLQPTSNPPDPFPVGRERYVNALMALLSPALNEGAGRNVYVVGAPGTGKTLTARYVLDRLREEAKKAGFLVHVAYVNAGRTRSPYFTLLEIARSIGVNAPASGWQFTRLKEEFEKQRGGRPMIAAIDEADVLVSKVREPLIYYLNRQEKLTLVLITNRWDAISNLPARAKSTLQLAPIIFEPYTEQEAKRILQERAALAFKAGAVNEEAIDLAASLAAEMADIRVGFNLLLTAGLLAEGQGRSEVDLVDIKRAERAVRPAM